MQKIGVMGGMFDPLHTGHLHAAQTALAFGLDQVLLCPCAAPPHRAQAFASAEHRLRMCEIAAAQQEGLVACDVDLRSDTCYAADTAQLLHERYPDAQLYWIIGADKLPSLAKWHKAAQLFEACRFLVCPRPGYDAHLPVPGAKIHVLSTEDLPFSSGQIVKKLQAYDDAIPDILPEISRYIAENGLYQPDFVPELLQRGMKEHRLAHTLGVRQTAVKLAFLHGAGMQKAAVAAMLHDIAKPLPLEEMQRLAQRYNLPLPEEILRDGNLLHGPVAAAIAQQELHITDADILSAIACHTAGKTGMSALDMCVFLADAIEPNRRPYPGLDEMRRLADVNLPAAVLLSMQRTREYVLSQGHHFCSQTEQAMQDIINHYQEALKV